MKISAALALAAAGTASAYSVNRSTLRSLGQRSVGNSARTHVRSNDIKMEGEYRKVHPLQFGDSPMRRCFLTPVSAIPVSLNDEF